MPPFHDDQARRNYEVYELLAENGYVDWAMTALFYTALHCVDNWFCQNNWGQPRSHGQRNEYLSRVAPADVHDAYMKLRENADLTRYDQWQGYFGADELRTAHEDDYSVVCDFVDAPCQIRPPNDAEE